MFGKQKYLMGHTETMRGRIKEFKQITPHPFLSTTVPSLHYSIAHYGDRSPGEVLDLNSFYAVGGIKVSF